MDQQKEWSDKTFAKGRFTYQRALPISYHLQKESKELTDAVDMFLKNPNYETADAAHEELADVFLLLLDCACHIGVSAASLMLFAEQKHRKNTQRQWGEPDKNGVVEHLK